MPGLGWQCSKCTYEHKLPSDRCAMCNELRVTKEHMRDFVLGKPIPKEVQADSALAKRPPLDQAASRKRSKPTSSIVNP